jgi:ribosomal protein S18 acetylase RimI-like enzyme
MDWLVFPEDRPADLGSRLEGRGMPAGTGGNWLWIDLKRNLGRHPQVPKGLRFRKVRNDRMMAEWIAVSQEGFGAELGIFYDAYARHGYRSDASSVHYTGYVDESPVTSATLLDAGGCAAIYDVSTPPGYRRRGIGAAITYYLLQEIRSRGYADTWIWSSNVAKGVYRRLGFVRADFGLRAYKWRRPS